MTNNSVNCIKIKFRALSHPLQTYLSASAIAPMLFLNSVLNLKKNRFIYKVNSFQHSENNQKNIRLLFPSKRNNR